MGASCEAAVEMKRRKKKNELKLITALRIAFVSSIPMATHLELCNAALMQEHFCISGLYEVTEQSYRILRRNVAFFFSSKLGGKGRTLNSKTQSQLRQGHLEYFTFFAAYLFVCCCRLIDPLTSIQFSSYMYSRSAQHACRPLSLSVADLLIILRIYTKITQKASGQDFWKSLLGIWQIPRL